MWRRRRNFPLVTGFHTATSRSSTCAAIRNRVRAGEDFEVSVTVRNDSELDGEATLFLFIRDLVASVAPPLLVLKGVRKIALRGRESGRAMWRLSANDLSFIGPNLVPVLEPGRFQIHVGQSADPAGLVTEVIDLAS